jgi:ABC-type lipoprotein export system ATPase subunit
MTVTTRPWMQKTKHITRKRKMLTFKNYLTEALITFNRIAYPKYGQFVILAGGSGSGKGWVLKNLIGINAKVIDVDEMKLLVLKSDKLRAGIDASVGRKTTKDDLKNPKFVSDLHVYVNDKLGLRKKTT